MDEMDEDVGSFSSLDDDSTISVSTRSSSDLAEDGTSSSSNRDMEEEGPLFEMSFLAAHLPLRGGLSKHFQGKSQSFSSLADVRRLEDLAKPERWSRKKMKSPKSYGGGFDYQKALSCSKRITKKASRGFFSSAGGTRQGVLNSGRPPIHPQRLFGNIRAQALQFA